LSLDGDDLLLEATAPPPPEILELLSRHKPAIVMLLRPAQDGWSARDWQVFFDERSGIAELDGGLPPALLHAAPSNGSTGTLCARHPSVALFVAAMIVPTMRCSRTVSS
jgi:hypothetical protein